MEVSLADGLSMSDLTLREGQTASLIFRVSSFCFICDCVAKAIRQRASTGSVGGVIPLNLPPGIQNNQNGSVQDWTISRYLRLVGIVSSVSTGSSLNGTPSDDLA